MRCQKKNAAKAAQYREILSELWENLPTARRRAASRLIPKRLLGDDEVRVTPSYASWLAKQRGDDAADVRFRNSLVGGTEGKMAVQSVLRHTIDIVDMLLEKGVDPDTALRLLPYEIYLAVTAAHEERFQCGPTAPASTSENLEYSVS